MLTASEIAARLLHLLQLQPHCGTYASSAPGWPKITLLGNSLRLMSESDLVHYVEHVK